MTHSMAVNLESGHGGTCYCIDTNESRPHQTHVQPPSSMTCVSWFAYPNPYGAFCESYQHWHNEMISKQKWLVV